MPKVTDAVALVSPVHTRFGASGVKLRARNLGATGIKCLESVVPLKRRLLARPDTVLAHEPLYKAQAYTLA